MSVGLESLFLSTTYSSMMRTDELSVTCYDSNSVQASKKSIHRRSHINIFSTPTTAHVFYVR